MLLREEDLSAISALTLTNAFVIDGQIICLAEELEDDWAMYKIDTSGSDLLDNLIFLYVEKIDRSSWNSLNRPIVVHENVAYTWLFSESSVITGRMGMLKFH
ncbi:hypothetical protein PMAYCL1PPCAC_28669, partial [Pristionchus mayeri]